MLSSVDYLFQICGLYEQHHIHICVLKCEDLSYIVEKRSRALL
jgi:hypothetical protein